MSAKSLISTVAVMTIGFWSSAAWADEAFDFGENGVPVEEAVVRMLERVPIVGIAELHGVRNAVDMYLDLMRDPAFREVVDYVYLEWATQRHQDVLDRYVAGEPVDDDDLARVWRDNTQALIQFDPAEYRYLLDGVREINRALTGADRVRLIAGDPSIDWENISSERDLAPMGNRDSWLAERLANEVVKADKRALVILGGSHLFRNREGNAYAFLEAMHPGSIRILEMVTGLSGANGMPARTAPASWPAVVSADHPLGGTRLSRFMKLYEFSGRLEHAVDTAIRTSVMHEIDPSSVSQTELAAAVGSIRVADGEIREVEMDPEDGTDERLRDRADGFIFFGPHDPIESFDAPGALAENDRFWEVLDAKHRAVYGRPVSPSVREGFRVE